MFRSGISPMRSSCWPNTFRSGRSCGCLSHPVGRRASAAMPAISVLRKGILDMLLFFTAAVGGAGRLLIERHDDFENAPRSRNALYLDPSAVVLDDAFADGKAETGAVALGLGREEG